MSSTILCTCGASNAVVNYGGREWPSKVTTQIQKSISKSENSKLKVGFLSEHFKLKLTKCKIHLQNT